MSAWTVIAHTEVGSGGTGTIDFTSIPQTYTDLCLLFSSRGDNTTVSGRFYINNDQTMANYYTRILYGSGSGSGQSIGAASSGDHNGVASWLNQPSNYTSNTFNNVMMYIPNYAGNTNKSISLDSVIENNATASFQVIAASIWNNTAAINRITLLDALLGNQVQYSSATLYGITKGSSGGVTVS